MTGKLHLLDQTGEIACMVAPAGRHTAGHDCARNCCKKASTKEEPLNCPYDQIWHSNAMIQIKRFEVVMEKFQASNFVQENFNEGTNRTYLQFSFDNTEVLISKDTCSQREKENSEKKKEKTEIGKDETAEKELTEVSDGKKYGFMCKIMFMVRNCEVPLLRKVREELCYPCGVEVKIVAVRRSDAQCVTPKNRSSTSERNASCSSSSYNFLSDFQLQRKSGALKLAKNSLCWSQYLHPGCFYVITETVSNEASSRMLRDGNLEPLINVSSDMELEKVCWCESCGVISSSRDTENSADIGKVLKGLKADFLKNDKLCSVDDILNDVVGQKQGSENSLQPRYGMDFVVLTNLLVIVVSMLYNLYFYSCW